MATSCASGLKSYSTSDRLRELKGERDRSQRDYWGSYVKRDYDRQFRLPVYIKRF